MASYFDTRPVQQYMGQQEAVVKGTQGMQSPYAKFQSTGDIEKGFGMSRDVTGAFAPFRQALEMQGARRKKQARLMGRPGAQPGMTFSDIDLETQQGLSQLGGEQARATMGRESEIAGLYGTALGAQGQFQQWLPSFQAGQYGNLAQQQMGIQDALAKYRKPTFWEGAGQFVTGLAPGIGAFLGAGAGG